MPRSAPVDVPRSDADRESGLTLVELVFAMAIFGIVAAAVLSGLVSAMQTTRADRDRVAASDLGARELEIVRNAFGASAAAPMALAATPYVTDPDPLPGGTAGRPLVVDHVPYTVTRHVTWVTAGSGTSTCDGGAAVSYPTLSVHVSVTWPAMGNVQPVVSTTLLTPPKGTVSSSLGFVGVKVLTASGRPASGDVVTLTGPGGTSSDVTADDGCAVFATATAGTYTAALNTPGDVDFYGNQLASKTVVVSAGNLQQLQFSYDRAASLAVTMSTASGYRLPSSLPALTLANTGLTPTGTRTFAASGPTTTLTGLWPFADGYTTWAAGCTQGDPAASGGTRAAAAVPAPGGSAAVTVALAPVVVSVTTAPTAGSLPVAGAAVVAYPVSTAGCLANENPLALGTTEAGGRLLTSLPAGAWRIQVTGRTPAPGWPTTPVLLPSSGPTLVLVVTQ